LFSKNLIKDDYTIPFLNDDETKEKLNTVINLREPNLQKAFRRTSEFKFPEATTVTNRTTFKDNSFVDRSKSYQNKIPKVDPSYYTTRVDDSEGEDESHL